MSEKLTDLITDIMENGIDTENRVIYFGKDCENEEEDLMSINEATVDDCIKKIDILNTLDKKHNPITIKMTTNGGSVYQALRLVDAIKNSSSQVIFEGSGIVASSGVLILMACDLRGLTPNTTLLIHSVSSSNDGSSFHNNSIDFKEHNRLQSIMIKHLALNTHMKESFWREVIKSDLYINAHEALKMRLIDHIIRSRSRDELRKYRNEKFKERNEKSLKNLRSRILKRMNLPSLD